MWTRGKRAPPACFRSAVDRRPTEACEVPSTIMNVAKQRLFARSKLCLSQGNVLPNSARFSKTYRLYSWCQRDIRSRLLTNSASSPVTVFQRPFTRDNAPKQSTVQTFKFCVLLRRIPPVFLIRMTFRDRLVDELCLVSTDSFPKTFHHTEGIDCAHSLSARSSNISPVFLVSASA